MAPDIDPAKAADLAAKAEDVTAKAQDLAAKEAELNADITAQSVSDATIGGLNTAADTLEKTAEAVGLDPTGITAAADTGINTLEDLSDATIGSATVNSAIDMGNAAGALNDSVSAFTDAAADLGTAASNDPMAAMNDMIGQLTQSLGGASGSEAPAVSDAAIGSMNTAADTLEKTAQAVGIDPTELTAAADTGINAAEDLSNAAIGAAESGAPASAAQAVSDATIGSLNTAAEGLEQTAQAVGLDPTGITAAADTGINAAEDVSNAVIGAAADDPMAAMNDMLGQFAQGLGGASGSEAQAVSDATIGTLNTAADTLEKTAQAVGMDPTEITAAADTGINAAEDVSNAAIGAAESGASGSAAQAVADATIGTPSSVGASLDLGEPAAVSDVGDVSLDTLGSADTADATGDAVGAAAGDAADAGIGLGDVAGALGYIQAGEDVLKGEYTEAAGELAGNALGDAIAGPIGGMVGGFVGEEVGTVLDDAGVNDAMDAVGSGVEDAAESAGTAVGDAASDVADAAEGAASDVEDAAESAASDVGDAAESAASDVEDAASDVADDIGDLF